MFYHRILKYCYHFHGTRYFYAWLKNNHSANFITVFRKFAKDKSSEWITLFKTDSIRAGCFDCQNRNPSTKR